MSLQSNGNRATVPIIDDLIGNTTLSEELRGDYERAQTQAELHVNTTRRQQNIPLLAQSLLGLGIVQLLQGETQNARKSLVEAINLTVDPNIRLRATAYALQTLFMHFNHFPGGAVGNAADLDILVNLPEAMKLWLDRIRHVAKSVRNTGVLLEPDILLSRRTVMYGRNVSRWNETDAKHRMTLINSLENDQESLQARGIPLRDLMAINLQIASLRFDAGDYAEADSNVRIAAEVYEQLFDVVGKANCLLKQGDWRVAPFSTPEVWNTTVNEGLYGNDLHWKIEAMEHDVRPENAKQAQWYYFEARKLYEEGGSKRGLAAIELRLGYLATLVTQNGEDATADYEQAVEHAMRASQLYESAGDLAGLQLARTHLALSQIGMSQLSETQLTVHSISQWGRTRGSHSFCLGLGRMMARIGRRWLVRDGDYERALACYRLAEHLFEHMKAERSRLTVLNDQANVYALVGERSRYVATSERVLDGLTDLANTPVLADWASMERKRVTMDLFSAAQTHQDSSAMRRIIGRLKILQGSKEQSLEDLVGDLGRLAMSGTEAFSQILPAAHNAWLGVVLGQAEFLEPLYRARQARIRGDDQEALKAFNEARQIADGSHGNNTAYPKSFMDYLIMSYQRRYQEALVPFQNYLTQKLEATDRMDSIGSVPQLQSDRVRHIYSQAFYGMVCIKAFDEAEWWLQALIGVAGSNWWTLDGNPWDNLTAVAELKEIQGNFSAARNTYEQAMDVFSERRRFLTADQLKLALSGLSSTRYMYIQGARVALKQYEAAMLREEPRVAQEALGAAFRAVERGKVRSLLDLMTTGYMRQGGQKTPETDPINHWQRCSACLTVSCGQLMQLQSMSEPDAGQIRHIKEKIANDERNLEKAEADLTATDPLFYRAQRISSNILSLGGAARTIDKDTALLQYAFSAEDLCAWTITSSGIHQVHRTTLCENQLTQYIRQFHKKCSSGEPIPKHISNFLANNLVKPFDDTISTYSRLIVVSMGVGYLIPFHALSWRGQPLTATHTITYLPSTSFLQFLQSSRPVWKSTNILAIGNPANMSHENPAQDTSIPLASLPHAGTEAEIIAGLFPHSTALTGDKATFEAVYDALPSHSILHFATHGHLNADVPMLSAVSLAYGKELTVAGLTELRLSASLVVLSACRTGEGKASAGDDVVGLVRALFVAGAKAVMATLWAVDDAATTALMTEFYRRISEGDEPAVALQYAQNFLRTCERGGLDEKLEKLSVQLEDQKARKGTIQNVRMLRMQAELAPEQALEKDYSHPMYWAPFMLMGV